MQWYAGTSGYSYKQWRGPFYPKDVPQKDWLSWYATQLPSVEINNTFYRMPKAHVVEAWRDAVPDHFRFVIKASRRITHQARLADCDEAVGYLVDRAERLENRLGALLFQTPPFLRMDLERLQRFQALLPADMPVAFEFRHASWLTEPVYAALRERGHALVAMDGADEPAPVCAGSWCYLRLRQPGYSAADLADWRARVQDSGAQVAYAFFKHEDEGAAPLMARQFLELTDRNAKPAARAGRSGGTADRQRA